MRAWRKVENSKNQRAKASSREFKPWKFRILYWKTAYNRKGVHREIIMFIYKNQMHFMFLEKAISFVNAVDILQDIEEINYCNM